MCERQTMPPLSGLGLNCGVFPPSSGDSIQALLPSQCYVSAQAQGWQANSFTMLLHNTSSKASSSTYMSADLRLIQLDDALHVSSLSVAQHRGLSHPTPPNKPKLGIPSTYSTRTRESSNLLLLPAATPTPQPPAHQRCGTTAADRKARLAATLISSGRTTCTHLEPSGSYLQPAAHSLHFHLFFPTQASRSAGLRFKGPLCKHLAGLGGKATGVTGVAKREGLKKREGGSIENKL